MSDDLVFFNELYYQLSLGNSKITAKLLSKIIIDIIKHKNKIRKTFNAQCTQVSKVIQTAICKQKQLIVIHDRADRR